MLVQKHFSSTAAADDDIDDDDETRRVQSIYTLEKKSNFKLYIVCYNLLRSLQR